MTLLLAAVLLLVAGGFASLAAAGRPAVASLAGAGGAVAAALLGLVPAVSSLAGGAEEVVRYPWSVPGGSLALGLDPLSAFFLLPILVLGGLGAVYGRAYLEGGGRRLGVAWFSYDLLLASMVAVVLARNGLVFLVAWEVMSLAAFALVTYDHHEAPVRRAGWIYLLAAHVGTAFLVLLFLLLGAGPGSLDFEAFSPSPALASVAFSLAVLGFGVKAGLLPLYVWLPEAHAAAPSHVSALMSGALVKVGFYGILRILVLAGPPAPWWGPVLMALGLGGALLGIALAFQQRDLKRVLAFSTVENMGLVALGIGLGLHGASSGDPVLAGLGLGAALLHVWNHAAMKGLMFLSAGSVLHGARTRDLERLGGLLRRMPWTGGALVVGAVSIAGLPPLNGFVGEWLLYLGLLHGGVSGSGGGALASLLAVGALSLVGALAALAFVRLAGIALLGEPRSEDAARAHEPGLAMTVPLLVLAGLCIHLGAAPELPARALAGAAGEVLGREVDFSGLPLRTVGVLAAVLWVGLGALAAVLVVLGRRRPVAAGPTWGCGYPAGTPRIQYTARSFSQLATESLLPRFLRTRVSSEAPRGSFPAPGSLSTDCADPAIRGLYEPFVLRLADRFARLRWIQQGHLHLYLLYIAVVLLLALAWTALRPGGAP